MSKGKVVEVVYGNYHKYEIVRNSHFMGYEFHIYRDGKHWAGSFKSLPASVKYIEKHG